MPSCVSKQSDINIENLKRAVKQLIKRDNKETKRQKKQPSEKYSEDDEKPLINACQTVFSCLVDYGQEKGWSPPNSETEKTERLNKAVDTLEKELAQKSSENARLIEENKKTVTLREEHEKALRLIEEQEKTLSAQKIEISKTEERASELNEKVNSLNSELAQKTSENDKLTEEHDKILLAQKFEIDKTEARASELNEKVNSLNSELAQKTSENDKLQSELKGAEQTIDTMLTQNTIAAEEYKAELRDMSCERDGLKRQLQANQEQYKQLKRHSEENDSNLRNTIDNLHGSMIAERKAKEDALTRLSAAAASKLRDKNPGITDLSDPNRPLKLAEKISELYDNEWTNAMENLEDQDVDEIHGIELLLKIFTTIFTLFLELGDQQLLDFPRMVIYPKSILPDKSTCDMMKDIPEIPTEILKPMKDFRKMNALSVVPSLEKVAFQALKNEDISDSVIDACMEYIKSCTEICWLMRVQDPPVHIKWNFEKGEDFDTNIMRSYTKSGQFVDFVVWPVLYLHKDGPLLAKGVIQGAKLKAVVKNSTEDDVQGKTQNDSTKEREVDPAPEKNGTNEAVVLTTESDDVEEQRKIETEGHKELEKKSEVDTQVTEPHDTTDDNEKNNDPQEVNIKCDPTESEGSELKNGVEEGKGAEDQRDLNAESDKDEKKTDPQEVNIKCDPTETEGSELNNGVEEGKGAEATEDHRDLNAESDEDEKNTDPQEVNTEFDSTETEGTELNSGVEERKWAEATKDKKDLNTESDEDDLYSDASDKFDKIGIQESGDGDPLHPNHERSEENGKEDREVHPNHERSEENGKEDHEDTNSEADDIPYADACENEYESNEPPSSTAINEINSTDDNNTEKNISRNKAECTDDLQLD